MGRRVLAVGRWVVVAALVVAAGCSPREEKAIEVVDADPIQVGWSGVSMYRGTPEHTGEAGPGERLRMPPREAWRFGPVNVGIHTASKSSPVADDERVYVGADNERFYAVDKRTGELVWRWVSRPCKHGIHATAAVDGERVYIGDYGGWLTALDSHTGEMVWERELGDHIGASPVLVGDVIYVGVELSDPDGFLAAVDRHTGKVLFTSEGFGDHTHSTPTVDVATSRVYLGSNRGFLLCFDAGSGREIWHFAPRGALDAWPPDKKPKYHAQIKSTAALVGSRLLFTSWDRHLYCVDAGTGEELWRFKTGQRTMSSPTVNPTTGRVFFGSHDHNVYAVDLETGRRVWRFTTDRRVFSSGVVVQRADDAGEVLVIGSSDGHVYALDEATGDKVWKVDVGSAVTGVPLVSDGRLYVSTNGGELICWQ